MYIKEPYNLETVIKWLFFFADPRFRFSIFFWNKSKSIHFWDNFSAVSFALTANGWWSVSPMKYFISFECHVHSHECSPKFVKKWTQNSKESHHNNQCVHSVHIKLHPFFANQNSEVTFADLPNHIAVSSLTGESPDSCPVKAPHNSVRSELPSTVYSTQQGCYLMIYRIVINHRLPVKL